MTAHLSFPFEEMEEVEKDLWNLWTTKKIFAFVFSLFLFYCSNLFIRFTLFILFYFFLLFPANSFLLRFFSFLLFYVIQESTSFLLKKKPMRSLMWKMHTSRMGILNIVLFDRVEK